MMKFETALSIGDEAWSYNGGYGVETVTVGQIRVICTDSPGVAGHSTFSNYGPQKSYTEEYMCIETGIGSGSIFTLNKNIFVTREECEAAFAHDIAEKKKQKREYEEEERRSADRRIKALKFELEMLEERVKRDDY